MIGYEWWHGWNTDVNTIDFIRLTQRHGTAVAVNVTIGACDLQWENSGRHSVMVQAYLQQVRPIGLLLYCDRAISQVGFTLADVPARMYTQQCGQPVGNLACCVFTCILETRLIPSKIIHFLRAPLTVVRGAYCDRPCRGVFGWLVMFVNCG